MCSASISKFLVVLSFYLSFIFNYCQISDAFAYHFQTFYSSNPNFGANWQVISNLAGDLENAQPVTVFSIVKAVCCNHCTIQPCLECTREVHLWVALHYPALLWLCSVNHSYRRDGRGLFFVGRVSLISLAVKVISKAHHFGELWQLWRQTEDWGESIWPRAGGRVDIKSDTVSDAEPVGAVSLPWLVCTRPASSHRRVS